MGQVTIEQLKDKALGSLYFFDKFILGFNGANYPPARVGMEDKPHIELCKFVMDWSSGKRNKLILVPRKCLKTSCVTIGYSLFELAHDPSMTILIDSVERALSIRMLSQIRGVCESNELFKRTFGDWKSERGWTDYSLTIAEAPRGREINPSIGTSGVDSTRVSYHPRLMILDDLVDPDIVASPESLMKAIKHYQELEPMVGEQGRKIVIGTRQDMDDLYSWILENEADEYEVFIRSAINPDGTAYYPEMISLEWLKRLEAKNPYFCSCQYYNDPINPSATMFRRDDIEWYESNEELPEGTNYMTIDPAGYEGMGDKTAVVPVRVDKTQNIYILEGYYARLKPEDIVNVAFNYYTNMKIRRLGIEENYFRGGLAKSFERKGLEWGTKPRVELLKHYGRTQRKEDRISQLQTWFADGKIFLKGKRVTIGGKTQWVPDGPYMKAMYQQIISYPHAKLSDDLIDALAMHLEIIRPSGGLDQSQIKVEKPVDALFGY